MKQVELIKALSDKLNNQAGGIALLDAYYNGEQPMAFMAPEAREALGNRFTRMSSNIPRLAVTSLAERLRVTGFVRDGAPDPGLWARWLDNDLDQYAPIAHREALALGRAFVTVWARGGRAAVTVESASQLAVMRDPVTHEVTAALKRWTDGEKGHAVLYLPGKITRLVSAGNVSDPAAIPTTGWEAVESLHNPFGIVPVVPMINSDRLLDLEGRSEIADLLPLADALNKSLADLMVASEYYARPRRWASGVELVEDENGETVNPFPAGHRMMISEAPDTKFGQLPAADLGAYEAGVKVLLSQIMAATGLPPHMVGIFQDTPPSADALRASEAGLTARAQAKQATFGRAWEQVAALMVAAETGADPRTFDVHVSWSDPATRSVAQEADATVKLYAAGLLPASVALARLGYRDDEITAIRAARRSDALDSAGVDVLREVAQ